MLVEFQVTNFRSIREPATLSMAKTSGSELADTHTFDPQTASVPHLLRGALIYGPNASGKSNLVKALKTMRELVLYSAKGGQEGELLPVAPFRLDVDSPNQPSEFEIVFISEGVRYQYGFAATMERVTAEWLLAFPEGRRQRLIEREYDKRHRTYVWGRMAKLSGRKKVLQDATRPNALFLSTAIQLNNEQLGPVYRWFRETLHVLGCEDFALGDSIQGAALSRSLCRHPSAKRGILTFLQVADINIDGILLEEEQFELPEKLAQLLPPDAREAAEKMRGQSLEVPYPAHRLADGTLTRFEWEDESAGTRRLFDLAGPILIALKKNRVLIIDELGRSLHALLVRFLLRVFHAPEFASSTAQLVCTTHETSALDQEIIRRDQVWFCEKDAKRATQLFPLIDFSPRKGTENLEYGYLSGRYSALPYVKDIRLLREQSDEQK